MPSVNKFLSAVLLVVVGVVIGRMTLPKPDALPNDASAQQIFTASPFWEAWNKLHDNFIGSLDPKALVYGAISGMIRASGDPYTAFSDPDASKQFKESLRGSFSGIGAEMGIKSGLIVVIAPLSGSPAEKAGVQAGDVVVAVDKEPITEDMSLDEVVRSIRGPKGEKVELTLLHKDAKETSDITIVRDDIEVQSVKMEVRDGIAIITITNFNEDTAQKFVEVAKRAKQQNVKGVVLDVRNNPGGYLDAAVTIASQFLQPGDAVVTEKGKKEITHSSKISGTLHGIPVVVLVNHGSASASEILAGALQDNLDTPIVGEKSFGKGSVQEVLTLSDDSTLRVTIAKWFTPKGKSINEQGIEPSVTVKDDTNTPEDEQLQKAIEEVKK